jgi:CO/xanthine dehydrogenase FAD-binding subunit
VIGRSKTGENRVSMKPAAFRYVRPLDLEEAMSALRDHGSEAKILAGGQSLVPLLNFRMLRPSALIDINRIPGLDYVTETELGGVRIGCLTRHYTLETSPAIRSRFPILQTAVTHVAHLAVRNRGTIGGSLSHADPAAELPMMAVLLDAQIAICAADRTRTLEAKNFFLGSLTTALEADEIVTEISLPGVDPATGWGFEEFALRPGDFAFAAVAALIRLREGQAVEARIALMGVDETPVRASEAENLLLGERHREDLIRAAAESARAAVNPNTDLRASADYRRHLVAALTERALEAAWRRADGAGR